MSQHNSSVCGLLLIPKHSTQKSRTEYVSLCPTESSKVPDFAFLDSQNTRILQSCNGLLLLYSQPSKFYIYNPMTRKQEALPSSLYMAYQFALNLAFDPLFSPHYKVVCIQKLDPQKPLHQIAIYSSKTGLWSPRGEPFYAPGDLDFNDGVFSNGAMHWMRRTSKGLYFDIEKGMLREMPKPPLKEGYSLVSCEYFAESHGHLYYVLACPDMPYLELFQMNEDYGGWGLKSQIDLRALAEDFPVMARRLNDPHAFFPCYECDVLFVSRGLVAEDMEIVLSIPGEVIAYNHEKKFVKKLCDTRLQPDDRAVWYRVYSSYRYPTFFEFIVTEPPEEEVCLSKKARK